MDFDDIVQHYPHQPKTIAHSGTTLAFPNTYVCPSCGSGDLRLARHDGQPQCACCGNDDFQPILRSAFVAKELRGD